MAMTCSVSLAFRVLGWPFSSRTSVPSAPVTGSSYSTGCITAAFA
jgi:hypothetical protein